MSVIKQVLEKASVDTNQLSGLVRPFFGYVVNNLTGFRDTEVAQNKAHGVFVTGDPEFNNPIITLSLQPPDDPSRLSGLKDKLDNSNPTSLAQFAADLVSGASDHQCKLVVSGILHVLSMIKQAKPVLIISLQPKYYIKNLLSGNGLGAFSQYQLLIEYNSGNKTLLYEEIYNETAIKNYIVGAIQGTPGQDIEISPISAIISIIQGHQAGEPGIKSTSQSMVVERPTSAAFERMLFGSMTCLT
jgi:hypothetical protein